MNSNPPLSNIDSSTPPPSTLSSSNVQSRSRQRSAVWNYFIKSDDRTVDRTVICKVLGINRNGQVVECGKELKYNKDGTTSGMKYHLRSEHHIINRQLHSDVAHE